MSRIPLLTENGLLGQQGLLQPRKLDYEVRSGWLSKHWAHVS